MSKQDIPEKYVIRFEKEHDVELNFIDDINGKITYSKSLLDFEGIAKGEKVQMIITIEQSVPTKLEKVWYAQKLRLMKKGGDCNRTDDDKKQHPIK